MKFLTAKLFIEYEGVIINGRVIILDNGDSGGIIGVASLSLARQYLSNSSFPNHHVNMVASINSHHFISCSHQYNLVPFPAHAFLGVLTYPIHKLSFPTHINMVASINSHHFISCSHQQSHWRCPPHPLTVISHNWRKFQS